MANMDSNVASKVSCTSTRNFVKQILSCQCEGGNVHVLVSSKERLHDSYTDVSMVNHSLIPRPEGEEKGIGFSHLRMCLIYHCFKHIFISGRVLMMPSKLHSRLCDAPAKCIIIVHVSNHSELAYQASLSSTYLALLANSFALFTSKEHQQKGRRKYIQWKHRVPLAIVLPVG